MKSLDMLPGNGEEEVEGDSAGNLREEVRDANMLRALANPHRLKILKLLDRSPHTVMDLCERLSLRQSLASQHLARLRVDGIVAAERQGHHVVYTLQSGRARQILAILDGGKPRAPRKKRANGAAAAPAKRPAPNRQSV
jgi:ArsR family transcriptional regulator, virulence genes transcriptional regulator